jgi:dihydropteroate synthase
MLWRTSKRSFDLTRHGLIMGIVNVTPDSFSDGGQFYDIAAAVAHGKELLAEGADILDIGGESTRPGSALVPAEEEARRVVPVIQRLVAETGAAVSIDTWKAGVAEAALAAGAEIINDISGLTRDPAMLPLAARTEAGLVLMHMQGTPQTMQRDPRYGDVVAEVGAFFRERLETCRAAGIAEERLCFDPGIGFGKTLQHNLLLLKHLRPLGDTVPGRPLLLGASRKSFIGKILGSPEMNDRNWPTVAITAHARAEGARIMRVHEVKANHDALKFSEAALWNSPN